MLWCTDHGGLRYHLAVGDSDVLEEGFRRRCVPGLYTALQAIHGLSAVCHNGRVSRLRGWELEVENNVGCEVNRRFRALCRFDTEDDARHQMQVQQITVTSPWRNQRVHAENDLSHIQTTFLKMALLLPNALWYPMTLL